MRSLYSSFHNGMGLIYTKIDDLNHMGVFWGEIYYQEYFFVAKNIQFKKVFFKERKQKKFFNIEFMQFRQDKSGKKMDEN